MEVPIIDNKIKSLVATLNELGIPTTGSCKGHIDHGSPAPWIKVMNPDILILEKAHRLLNKFYSNRTVSPEIQFIIERGKSGFWIHNGGEDYKRWRELVNERVKKIQNGIEAPEVISTENKYYRARRLPAYQAEISPLVDFLLKQLSN